MSKMFRNKLFSKQRLYRLKMQEDYNLQQHVNTFSTIITDLVRFGVKVGDINNILVCLLPHLATTW